MNKANTEVLGLNYTQIPPHYIRALSSIFAEGAEKYGKDNWKRGLNDPEWIEERINHAIDHLLRYLEGDRTENHLAKVGWAMCVLSERDRIQTKQEPKNLGPVAKTFYDGTVSNLFQS
jgi:hypothetical protein